MSFEGPIQTKAQPSSMRKPAQKEPVKNNPSAMAQRRSGMPDAKAIQAARPYSAAKFLGDESIVNGTKTSGSGPVQAKIPMGKPGDRFEVEADSMADKVMQMPETGQKMASASGGDDTGRADANGSAPANASAHAPTSDVAQRVSRLITRKEEEGLQASADENAAPAQAMGSADSPEKAQTKEDKALPQAEEGPSHNKDPVQAASMPDAVGPVPTARPQSEPESQAAQAAKDPAQATIVSRMAGETDKSQPSPGLSASADPSVSASAEPSALRSSDSALQTSSTEEPAQASFVSRNESEPETNKGPPAQATQVASPSDSAQRTSLPDSPAQSKCAECAVKPTPTARPQMEDTVGPTPTAQAQTEDAAPAAQPQPDEAASAAQTKSACPTCGGDHAAQSKGAGQSSTVPGEVETKINSSKGSGQPMDQGTKGFMENRFGADFSGVRIHNDGNAAAMTSGIKAQAFAHGSDIYFAPGKYNPETSSGKRLLAHELTHTIQQGASQPVQSKPVQDKNEKSENTAQSVSRTPEAVQGFLGIFDSEDPCEDKKKEEKEPEKDDETQAAEKTCNQLNPPAPEAPKGTKEPDQNKEPPPTEAREGANADARQANAPPPSAEEPETEKNVGEKSVKEPSGPCAETVPSVTPGPGAMKQLNEGSKGENKKDAKEKSAADAAGGAKKKEGDTQWLKKAAKVPQSAKVKGAGLGENASPVVKVERNQAQAELAQANGMLNAEQKDIRAVDTSQVQYLPSGSSDKKTQEEETVGNAAARNAAETAKLRLVEMTDEAQDTSKTVQDDVRQKKKAIQSLVKQRKAQTNAVFQQMNTQATVKATLSVVQITVRHALTVAKVKLQALSSRMLITQARHKASADLIIKGKEALSALDQQYASAAARLRSIGVEKGKIAKGIGEERSSAYRKGEGASAGKRDLVVNKKKDGFWDGYLTYNRYMARADAAKETGKQYAEGFEKEAGKKADAIPCGKSKDIQLIEAAILQGEINLKCAFDKSIKGVDDQEKAALDVANASKKEAVDSINSGHKATTTKLREKKEAQLQFLNDFGIRQEMAIERDASKGLAAALKQTAGGVSAMKKLLADYSNSVKSSRAPPAAQSKDEAAQLLSTISQQSDAARKGLKAVRSDLGSSTAKAQSTAESELISQNDKGISELRKLGQEYIAIVDEVREGTLTGLINLQTTSQQRQSLAVTDAKACFAGVLTGIDTLLKRIRDGTQKLFDEAAQAMEDKFQNKIDTQLPMQICVEAEKAAAQVEPWWKSLLKILLIILVVLIVVLVIGPAVIGALGAMAGSLAGTLGASAALAGAIETVIITGLTWAMEGAAMSVLFQAGANIYMGVDVFNGMGDAIIVGLITGPFGGLGGKLAGVLIKGTGVAAFIGKFGIQTVFLAGGMITADAALGREFNLKSFLKNLTIASAISLLLQGAFKIRAVWKSRGVRNLPAKRQPPPRSKSGKTESAVINWIHDLRTNTYLLRNPHTGKLDLLFDPHTGYLYRMNPATGQWMFLAKVGPGAPQLGGPGQAGGGSNAGGGSGQSGGGGKSNTGTGTGIVPYKPPGPGGSGSKPPVVVPPLVKPPALPPGPGGSGAKPPGVVPPIVIPPVVKPPALPPASPATLVASGNSMAQAAGLPNSPPGYYWTGSPGNLSLAKLPGNTGFDLHYDPTANIAGLPPGFAISNSNFTPAQLGIVTARGSVALDFLGTYGTKGLSVLEGVSNKLPGAKFNEVMLASQSGKITNLQGWIDFNHQKALAEMENAAIELREALRLTTENPGSTVMVGKESTSPRRPNGDLTQDVDLEMRGPGGSITGSIELSSIQNKLAKVDELLNRTTGLGHIIEKVKSRMVDNASHGTPLIQQPKAIIEVDVASGSTNTGGGTVYSYPNGVREFITNTGVLNPGKSWPQDIFNDFVTPGKKGSIYTLPDNNLINGLTIVNRSGDVLAEYVNNGGTWVRIR